MDIRKFAPLAALGLAAALSACSSNDISINGAKGKPLAELDLSGPPPHGVAVMGPDKVRITPGDKLAIHVDGDKDQVAKLRFTLKDGTLGILREKGLFADGTPVIITVTMPTPKELLMAGSGSISSPTLASKAEVSIAGSGDIETPSVAVDKLEVSIAGSGSYRAGGTVSSLELNIAGSGNGNMAGLKVDKADVSIAGSGDAAFASDGRVKASVIGSGTVRVKGRAQCEVSAMGSGKLVCEP